MRALIALGLAVALTACGGGGGGSGGGTPPPPPPANSAPSFTSAATASVPENTTGAFYTATATDPENNTLTFSIAGGADAARFSINATSGALSFVSPPDFEAPTDSNADNAYDVTLGVFDGALSASLALRVTVTNVAGTTAFQRVATGLTQPLFVAATNDNSGRVYVVQKTGQIRILTPSTGAIASTPFLDISTQISTSGEQGLLSMALAPDFASTGTFYVHMNNTSGDTEIRRYRTFTGNRDQADPSTGDVILTLDQPSATNHKGGWLGFDSAGLLYISLGDGGAAPSNSQATNLLFGRILRINPATDSFPSDPNRDYAIPSGNPYPSSGAPETWVYGLRNPFRASFDRANGNLYIGDVGENAIEEIDLVRPSSDAGLNFGWPTMEGLNGGPVSGLAPPIAQYNHGSGAFDGNSITGGYVYRGPIAALQGHYFFGDFIRGRIWSIPVSSFAQGLTLTAPTGFTDRTAQFAPASPNVIANVSTFGEDQAGNLYVADYFDGEIYRLASTE